MKWVAFTMSHDVPKTVTIRIDQIAAFEDGDKGEVEVIMNNGQSYMVKGDFTEITQKLKLSPMITLS